MIAGRAFAIAMVAATSGLQSSRGSLPAKPLECPPPQYPAVLHNVEGRVEARASVAVDGSVKDVTILTRNPNEAFASAAKEALQRWRFEPATGVKPIERTYSQHFYFSPPDGIPLQFGVDTVTRSRLAVSDRSVAIKAGREWILSLLVFADFELTGNVRIHERADAALLVRAWAEGASTKEATYRIALGSDDAKHPAGTVWSSGDLSFTTRSYDPEAATAYRRAASDWQQIKVTCLDKSLQVYLGGRLVSDAQLFDEFTGRMGFAVSSGTLEFRNFRARRLDQHRLNVPLSVRFPDAILPWGPGVIRPVPTFSPRPDYTRRAMREHVTGVVSLEIVIEADGSVSRVQVTEPLDDELDARAVSTVKRWRFKPAYRDGEAVRCLADVELAFEL